MIETLNQIIEDGIRKKLVHNFTDNNNEIADNQISIDNATMLNFGSCSYLGLEKRPELQQGTIEAVKKYGTQFSSSRTYVSHGLYKELENLLYQIFHRPLIVTASTTLGHLASIPVLIGTNDAIVLDLQVHSSIQMSVQQLKAKGIPISVIKHNCMESLESKIKILSQKYDKIWYFADGVYSMYGDYAPFKKLDQLLEKYKKFHLYIDDAHGMSWSGKNGCGIVASQMKSTDKMVLAVSLNKSFGCAGGCLIFPNKETEKKVRNCGGTYIFSGPIQPPMLGACVSSAKLHLSEPFEKLQKHLDQLIKHTNQKLDELDFPQFEKTNSPLFFIPVGLPKICSDIVLEMRHRGFFLNTASFPAVPMRRSGIRFMINNFFKTMEIDLMLMNLSQVYIDVTLKYQMSYVEIAKNFRIPPFNIKSIYTEEKETQKEKPNHNKLTLEEFSSIRNLKPDQWSILSKQNNMLNIPHLELLEKTYHKENTNTENQWDFYYFNIKDNTKQIVLQSLITIALLKDDTLSDKETSQKIENLRKSENNPYLFCSKTIIVGTPITKGNHLYIDHKHQQWQEAISLFTEKLNDILESQKASKVIIRDFDEIQTEKLKNIMLEKGFTKLELPDTMQVNNFDWNTQDEFLKSLSQKYRYNTKKEIIAYQNLFETSYKKPKDSIEIEKLYKLYQQVYEKSHIINVFQLPYQYFENICLDPQYDIISLYHKKNNTLAAVMFSYTYNNHYNALIVGLNYDYVYQHKAYKQILYQTLQRAKQLNCHHLDLGFTAELEKKKIGAKTQKVFAYVQSTEHLKQSILNFL